MIQAEDDSPEVRRYVCRGLVMIQEFNIEQLEPSMNDLVSYDVITDDSL